MQALVLIRHGEAQHLLRDQVGGWSDTALTDRGRAQARRTGGALLRILDERPCAIYCSDLSRTAETAQIIASVLNVQHVPLFGLRDLNNGAAANRSQEEAAQMALPMTEPVIDWVPYPEAESWGMMHDRVAGCMKDISKDAGNVRVIVSHANPIVSIVHWWLRFPRHMLTTTSFEIAPCSITRLIENLSTERIIAKLNETCHLKGV